MKHINIAVHKELRKTVFISMALHAFCFSCVTFTFVNKINYSMDIPLVFWGSILERSDIATSIEPQKNQDNTFLIKDNFIKKVPVAKAKSYHLFINKPNYKTMNIFLGKKSFTKLAIIRQHPKSKVNAESEKLDKIKESPILKDELKLKIE